MPASVPDKEGEGMRDGRGADIYKAGSWDSGEDKFQVAIFQAHHIVEHIFYVAEPGSGGLQQDGERRQQFIRQNVGEERENREWKRYDNAGWRWGNAGGIFVARNRWLLQQLHHVSQSMISSFNVFMTVVTYWRTSIDKTTESSEKIDKTTESSKKIDKTTESSKKIDKTTESSEKIDKTTESSEKIDKSTESSEKIDKSTESSD